MMIKSLVAWLRHFSSCRRARRGGNVSAHSCSEAPTSPEDLPLARRGSPTGRCGPGNPGMEHAPIWSSPAPPRRRAGGPPMFPHRSRRGSPSLLAAEGAQLDARDRSRGPGPTGGLAMCPGTTRCHLLHSVGLTSTSSREEPLPRVCVICIDVHVVRESPSPPPPSQLPPATATRKSRWPASARRRSPPRPSAAHAPSPLPLRSLRQSRCRAAAPTCVVGHLGSTR